MKNFTINLVGKLILTLNLGDIFLSNLRVYLAAIENYLKQTECETFRDCLFLEQIRQNQPRVTDRSYEYGWLIENLNQQKGRLLDVGSVSSSLLTLMPKDISVYAINTSKSALPKFPKIKSFVGDIRRPLFRSNFFDIVSSISTIEHIGVPGRYGSDDDPEGDFLAMQEIHRVLKKNGLLLLTVPYGQKNVYPLNRIYNLHRLTRLLDRFAVKSIDYLKYQPALKAWLRTTESEAGKTQMLRDRWYAMAFIRATKK